MGASRKRILFAIPTLEVGGAETILLETVKALHGRYDIDVLVLYDYPDVETLAPQMRQYARVIPVITYYKKAPFFKHVLASALWRFKRFLWHRLTPATLHRLLVKGSYDYEIAFLEGPATRLVGGAPEGSTCAIGWIHSDVIDFPWADKCFRDFDEQLECYRRFDRVFGVSSQVARHAQEKFGVKVGFVQNIIDGDAVKRAAADVSEDEGAKRPLLASVGSLKPVKGFDRAIRALGALHREGFSFEFHIVGEGPDHEVLGELIKQEGLESAVVLKGYQSNPYPYIKRADLYVCSSLSEGFSGAVTEALILGVPVITTRCAGMSDLLGESEWGLIVDNDEDALREGIRMLIDDRGLLEKYRKQAVRRGKDFSQEALAEGFVAAIEGRNDGQV